MKRLALFPVLLLAAAPVLAEPSCNPTDAPTPIWQSIKSFEDQGGQVVSFKINEGQCYEIYGKLDGTNMEVFFDPATGEELDRIES